MIAALLGKEVSQRRVPLALALGLVCLVAASMPFWFGFSLRQAQLHPSNETAALVMRNFRSYGFFLESTWLARGLGRTLMLLALVGGAGAIAGEREAKTLPMLAQSSMPLVLIGAVKFVATAAWLFLVAFASAGILAANSIVAGHDVPVVGILTGSFVAWANAVAFLAIVLFASAVSSRTLFAGMLALVLGVTIAAAFAPFGVNATALGAAVVGPGGAIDVTGAVRAVALAVGITTFALTAALGALDLRSA